jgi:hypothetical protein
LKVLLAAGYNSAPMRPLLLSVALLTFACSDGDSSTADARPPADVRLLADAGDVGSEDRADAGGDAAGDPMPDTADLATPDLPAPAMLEISPAVRDLGMVVKDTQLPHHFTVKNTGGSPSGSLDMKLITSTLDPNAFATVANGCDGILEPDATCDFEVRFVATVVGVHQALVTATASPGGMASGELKATVIAGP